MTGFNHTLFQRTFPLVGVVFPLLTFLSSTVEFWIKAAAASFAGVVLFVWMLVEILPACIGAIKRKKLKKLSKKHRSELRGLISDVNSYLSYSSERAPFQIWHELSNDTNCDIRMDYHYHGAIHTWLLDLQEASHRREKTPVVLAVSLSKAIAECGHLAERVSEDVDRYLEIVDLDANRAARFRKQWGSARESFNSWLQDCVKLFREINQGSNANCVTYIPPLPPLGH